MRPDQRSAAVTLLQLLESSEIFSYLFGFWLFLFSGRFRDHVRTTWRRRRGALKLLIPLEIAVATCCGWLPLVLLWSWLRS